MAENSNISWTDHTFNMWEGCQKVGPGCDNCYAEARNFRWAPKGSTSAPNWGPGAPRRLTSEANRKKPMKWDREAKAAGRIDFVFCSSLADVFDNAVDPEWRRDLFEIIRATPNLQWLLLTKRIGNVLGMVAEMAGRQDVGVFWPLNAALLITVVTQAEADRDIPKLMTAKHSLVPTFVGLSMEPLLEAVDISEWLFRFEPCADCPCPDPAVSREGYEACCRDPQMLPSLIDWVIVGGESGPNARPMDLDWARDLQRQCDAAAVPFHFKQVGGRTPDKGGHLLDGVLYDARPVLRG